MSPPAAGRRPRSLNTGVRGIPKLFPMERAQGAPPSHPQRAGRGGGGAPRRWPARSPVAAAAPSASLAAAAPRRAGVQFQRADERSLRPASRGRKEASGGCTGLGRGPGLREPGPGARRASGPEGDAREPRRQRRGDPRARRAGPRCAPRTDVPACSGRAGAGWGRPPALGLRGGVAERLFVSPGAACKCVCKCVCSRRRLQPRPPGRLSRCPRRTLARGDAARAAGEGGYFREVGGKRTGWGLPTRPQAAPQSWCGRCSVPSTKLLPSQHRPWEAGTLERLRFSAPNSGGCPNTAAAGP